MCIIVSKPKGVDLPSEEILNNCFTSNKDGIGISYNIEGDRPTIFKGFYNVKKLIKVLEQHNITKEHNLIVHFRYATHGKKDAGNCHPFPLSTSFDDMRLLHCACDTAIAHNGVFNGVQTHSDHSDTMKFIGGILASPEIIENLDKNSIKELIRGYCGHSSKLAFLRSSGISLVGDFEMEDGVYYSNRQFKTYAYKNDLYDGKSWCYIHKCKDDCTYCQEHKTWDDCSHKRLSNWRNRHKEEKTLLLGEFPQKCLRCQSEEDVSYDEEALGFLCSNCVIMLSNKGSIAY